MFPLSDPYLSAKEIRCSHGSMLSTLWTSKKDFEFAETLKSASWKRLDRRHTHIMTSRAREDKIS